MTGLGLASLLALVVLVAACDSSPLGPDISRPDPEEDEPSPGSPPVVSQPAGPTPDPASPDPDADPDAEPAPAPEPDPDPGTPTPDPAPAPAPDPSPGLNCSVTSTRDVWYAGGPVSHTIGCDDPITAVTSSGAPFTVSTTIDDTEVDLTGTAGAAAVTSWTAEVNGDAELDLTTTVLSTAGLNASQLASSTPAYDTAFDLTQTVALDATWDGQMANVTLKGQSIATDMHGVSYFASCATATVSYVCNDAGTNTGNTKDGQLSMRWKYSAFDQGTYYLDVNPRVTIESVATDLAIDTTSLSVPIQTNGNVAITHSDTAVNNNIAPIGFPYGVAIGTGGTATAPELGLMFPIRTTNNGFNFKEVTVDRTATPAAAGVVTQGAPGDFAQTTGNGLDYRIKALPGGKYVAAGAELVGSEYDLYLRIYADGSSTPAPIKVTSEPFTVANDEDVVAVAMSEVFTESSRTQVGVAYADLNTTTGFSKLVLAKVDTAGTDKGTLIWDSLYDSDSLTAAVYTPAGASKVDRIRLRYVSESGTGQFYVAFREATDIKVARFLSIHNGTNYALTSATAASGVLLDAIELADNFNSLDMAVGRTGGTTVVGVVYRNNTDGLCYWARFRSGLTDLAAPVAISNSSCAQPTVHYVAAANRFVVTYVDKPAGFFEIMTREITVAGSGADTLGTASTVVTSADAATNRFTKVETDYSAAYNWMAVFYRKSNAADASAIKIHGYHVRGR